MSAIQAIIFDCDGTLVDSEELGNRLLIDMARPHGFDSDESSLLEAFRGVRLADCMELIEQRAAIQLPEDFVERYRAALLEEFERSLKPIEGVEAALRALRHPKCVASGSPLSKLQFILKRFGWHHFFEGRVYSSYELDMWKPGPELFLHAAAQLGIEPSRIAVVEDSPVGVEAGVRAGMRVFHYLPGADPAQAGGVTVFGSMAVLPALIPH